MSIHELGQEQRDDVRAGDQWQAEYWVAIERGEIVIQRCDAGHYQFPGGPKCARCRNPVDWVRASGSGRVWSWAVFHHHYLEGFDPPYTVMIIELEEGVRMFAAPHQDERWSPWIGARVRLEVGEHCGRHVTVVRLAEGQGDETT